MLKETSLSGRGRKRASWLTNKDFREFYEEFIAKILNKMNDQSEN